MSTELDVYIARHPKSIDSFAIFLRRQGYTAYVEQDGDTTLLITDYQPTGIGFIYVGQRNHDLVRSTTNPPGPTGHRRRTTAQQEAGR